MRFGVALRESLVLNNWAFSSGTIEKEPSPFAIASSTSWSCSTTFALAGSAPTMSVTSASMSSCASNRTPSRGKFGSALGIYTTTYDTTRASRRAN